MNKKFFCALTIAGMLMSPVSVLAEEMEEVEAGSVGGTDVEQASTITLDEVNFPDDNFRTAVKLAYATVMNAEATAGGATKGPYDGIDWDSADETVKSKDKVKLSDLEKILTLATGFTDPSKVTLPTDLTNAKKAADWDGTAAAPFKNVIGIEYLTGLQYLSILNSPQLKEANLSKNENLVSVQIEGIVSPGADTAVTSYVLGGASPTVQAIDLYSLTLPEETTNLEELVVVGTLQLTTVDLSDYTALTTVTLPLNEIAELNVKGCASLTTLNVSQNDLVALDVSTNGALATVDGSNNHIYELSLPSGKKLETVLLANNKLTTLDISGLKGLKALSVADNRLESLDVSNNAALAALDVSYNHLATFDITGSALTGTAASWTAPVGTTPASGEVYSPQYLYANEGDAGIDLASYDENFQAKDSNNVGWDNVAAAGTGSTATPAYPNGGSINKNGIFEFDGDEGGAYAYTIGVASKYMTVNIVRADLMNRLYNPNSGEHFYTKDLNEKDVLVGLGWQDEGIGWVAPQENATGVTGAKESVFRLYNPNAGDHHYTLDSKEKDALVRAGWDYEGVGWYSAVPQGAWIAGGTDPDNLAAATTSAGYSIEVYREYNPNAKEAGAHNYTTSENENDVLVSLGWLDEGIGWRALK